MIKTLKTKQKGQKKSFVDFSKKERRLNIIKSNAVEQFAIKYYKEERWKVVKTCMPNKEFPFNVINKRGISRLKQKVKILEDINKIYNEKTHKVHLPDLICQRDNEIMFVEVKSSDIPIGKVIQKKTLERLGHLGYTIIVFKLPITIEELVKNKFVGKEVQPTEIRFTPIKNTTLDQFFNKQSNEIVSRK